MYTASEVTLTLTIVDFAKAMLIKIISDVDKINKY